jgi:hypothetical protein
MKTRELSKGFLNSLINSKGLLHIILERVKQDHTLMIAIRDGYINIYYRGGSLLKITESKDSFQFSFDQQYATVGTTLPTLPTIIRNHDDVKAWVDQCAKLKEIMDIYFSKYSKPEREFQQLVARENNNSTISNESEYFISDIEFADRSLGARFDMLAINWTASQRKDGNKCHAALVEMKYGDGALAGEAGLLKHLKDIEALVSDRNKYVTLLETMEGQFNQLDELGLLKFNHSRNRTKLKLDSNKNPEVIFILANHNPRSTKLRSILSDPKITAYGEKNQLFDLRFFVSSFSGYGLHSDCMLTLAQFREVLRCFQIKSAR